MKKIVSLIVLVIFIASCSNDDSNEMLSNEIQKLEKRANSQETARDAGDVLDTVAPPPPPPTELGTFCDECPIDPPKGGTKP